MGGFSGFAVSFGLSKPKVERLDQPAPGQESTAQPPPSAIGSPIAQHVESTVADEEATLPLPPQALPPQALPPQVILGSNGTRIAKEKAIGEPGRLGLVVEWRGLPGKTELSAAEVERATIEYNGVAVEVVVEDLLTQDVDAIVNAANGDLHLGGGVAGAIARADRENRIQAECNEMMSLGSKDKPKRRSRLPDGSVAKTSAGSIKQVQGKSTTYTTVLHAVGPVYKQSEKDQCARALYEAYYNTFRLAQQLELKSVALPYLSSAIFGYLPCYGSSKVALKATQDFLRDHPDGPLKRIVFCTVPFNREPHTWMLKAVEEAYSPSSAVPQ